MAQRWHYLLRKAIVDTWYDLGVIQGGKVNDNAVVPSYLLVSVRECVDPFEKDVVQRDCLGHPDVFDISVRDQILSELLCFDGHKFW